MAPLLQNRTQNLTLCIVGINSIQHAFVVGMEKAAKDEGQMPENLIITPRILRMNEQDPYTILETSSRRYFQRGYYHRRVLILPLHEHCPIAPLHEHAQSANIDLIILEPCIERHFLSAYGVPANLGLSIPQYETLLSEHFNQDYHPDKPDWHALQIKKIGIQKMIQGDSSIASIHEAVTSTNHKSYEQFAPRS